MPSSIENGNLSMTNSMKMTASNATVPHVFVILVLLLNGIGIVCKDVVYVYTTVSSLSLSLSLQYLSSFCGALGHSIDAVAETGHGYDC